MRKHATLKDSHSISFSEQVNQRLREGIFILTLAISLFLFLAFVTYHATDPGWSHTGSGEHIANLGGPAGAWLADVLLYLLGYLAYILPILITYSAFLLLRGGREEALDYHLLILRGGGFVLIMTSSCALVNLQISNVISSLPFTAGGVLGNVIGFGSDRYYLIPWLILAGFD